MYVVQVKDDEIPQGDVNRLKKKEILKTEEGRPLRKNDKIHNWAKISLSPQGMKFLERM